MNTLLPSFEEYVRILQSRVIWYEYSMLVETKAEPPPVVGNGIVGNEKEARSRGVRGRKCSLHGPFVRPIQGATHFIINFSSRFYSHEN